MGRHADNAEERERAFEDARRRKEEEGKPPWRPSIRVTLLCLVLTPVIFLIPWTVDTAVGNGAGRLVQPARYGSGEVRECSRVGPVSTSSGVGLWWTCQVSVNWDDGGRGDYPAEDSQFSPADVGRSFRVELGGLGWDSGEGYVDKIPDRYVVLRSGLEHPGWPAGVAMVATIPFWSIFVTIAYIGVRMWWTEFGNFLRARLPRR